MPSSFFSALNSAERPLDAAKYLADAQVDNAYTMALDVTGTDAAVVKDKGIFPIVSNLPERYHVGFSSQWSSPFARADISEVAGKFAGFLGGSTAGAVTGAVTGAAFKATGISTKLKAQSVQVWESSSSMSFSLDMVFHATTNSETDIRARHRALLKLAAPSEDGLILRQPGPIIINNGSPTGRRITLRVGNYLFLDNVIIKGVSSDISSLCTSDGIPISMTINIEVESFYACYTTQDIDKMFDSSGASGT